ncbi:uncharacterized protein PG998_014786 [Apiospora kogelbergensis]|uniref:uncharacterized protein n=1 Tax=Apiospora kogelbergensis TaxID=1337665 RepID=UPI00313144C1
MAHAVPTTSARTNLTKRLSDATYAEANQKGLSLRCLMAKNIEQTQSYQVADFLMDWENAATEGWVGVSNGEIPFFKHYLDQTFAALEGGLVFENPSDPSEEELDALTVNTQGNFESNGEVSGAQMYSSIDVTEGIFIADKSKTVQSSMKDLFGTNDWNEIGMWREHIASPSTLLEPAQSTYEDQSTTFPLETQVEIHFEDKQGNPNARACMYLALREWLSAINAVKPAA